MSFQPRMQNKIEGFSISAEPRRRSLDGIVAELWDVKCAENAGGHYISRDPRLFVVLEQKGTGIPSVKFRQHNQTRLTAASLNPISYIPAEMDLWVDFIGIHSVQHLDIHFSAEQLLCRFGDQIDPSQLNIPNLALNDERQMAIARLISAELNNPKPLHNLYSDGLILALLASTLKLERSDRRPRTTLAPWQLRRVKEYIEENCVRRIRLDDLASITGLSQSHFSHSFKASTGVSPHDWQIKARINHAKTMLKSKRVTLTNIAAETGFSDHSHFSRVFRHHVSISPSQWQKLHCSGVDNISQLDVI